MAGGYQFFDQDTNHQRSRYNDFVILTFQTWSLKSSEHPLGLENLLGSYCSHLITEIAVILITVLIQNSREGITICKRKVKYRSWLVIVLKEDLVRPCQSFSEIRGVLQNNFHDLKSIRGLRLRLHLAYKRRCGWSSVCHSKHHFSIQNRDLFLSVMHVLSFPFCFSFGDSRFLVIQVLEKMSQSNMMSKESVEKSLAAVTMKLRIKVPHFDNSALVQGYARTLIGRCMNLNDQSMRNILFMLPRIWGVEERVAGANLGLWRFQFDFDREEDIKEVMKMETFHLDHWVLSLVRWDPRVDASYPSYITFLIRVSGVPLHFWAELTFCTIGDALGEVKAVDLDAGMVMTRLLVRLKA